MTSGNDRLIGGSLQKGGGGDDVLNSRGYRRETGVDRLLGGAGDDRLRGDGQDGFGEKLDGGSGSDEITGGDGDDSLEGGPGADSCDQGSGSGPVRGCERSRR